MPSDSEAGWWSDEEQDAQIKVGVVESFATKMAKAVGVVSNTASAVTSSVSSPILCGVLAATEEEKEADATIKPTPSKSRTFLPDEEELLGEEFSFILDDSLFPASTPLPLE